MPIASPLSAGEDLALALRQATAAAHAQAEREPLVAALMNGTVSTGTYLRWLVALHGLYEALERGLDAWDAALVPPAVHRTQFLQDDITYWCRHLRCPRPAAGPAAQAYAGHLASLSESAPALLAAHAYVRYLGDLSGGRLMHRALTGLGGHAGPGTHPGLAFFVYPEGVSLALLRDQVRQGLRRAGRRTAPWAPVLDEAVDAFERHRAMMSEALQGTDTCA